MICGCRIEHVNHPSDPANLSGRAEGHCLMFCPLHAAAEQMREALSDITLEAYSVLEQHSEETLRAKLSQIEHIGRVALAASEGKEEKSR